MKPFPHCLVVFIILVSASLSLATEKNLLESERDADKVLAEPDIIHMRKEIAPVFEYADRCVVAGETNQALKYYLKGLEHQPWNLEAQLAVARLWQATGKTNEAREKAELVWKNAESEALMASSAQMLSLKFATQPIDDPWPTQTFALVLISYGPIDEWLLQDLRTNLEQMLNIPVFIRHPDLFIPEPGRNPLHGWAADLRSKIDRMNLSTNHLGEDSNVFAFAESMLNEQTNKETLRQFQQNLDLLQRLGPQWNAADLLKELNQTLPVHPRSGIGYLAVTRMDLYVNDNHFVFGLADTGANCGVFSYRRYLSAVTDEPPNRERLKQRVFKQALSSTGLLYGIPRCTDPTCARAYANSLAEHDAKEVRLCPVCQQGFSRRFQSPAE